MMSRALLPLVPALILLAACPAGAEPRFEVPVACEVGRDCFVQNYVDQDPGPGRLDFACGPLSYDRHGGTDFRVRDLVAMAQGTTVVAAAPGVVRGVRDGMEDVSLREIGAEAIRGREAGNAVVIDHGDGWETQYSHMRKGSVRVAPGQQVEAGQPLGLIGLSGNTEFPHLDFLVRKDGQVVDPFVGLVPFTGCDAPRRPLWSAAALAALPYQPGGLLNAGFSLETPDAERLRRGEQRAESLPTGAPAIVFWVDAFGGRKDDLLVITLVAPDGRTLANRHGRLDRNLASLFSYAGTRRPAGGWIPGCYRGEVELRRGGQTVFRESRCLNHAG